MALVSSHIYQKLKRALAAYGIVVRASNTSDLATDPTISSGSGAPSEAEPNGSIYLRTNGASGTTLYTRVSGAWVASGAETLADAVLTALATYGLDRQVSATIAVADSATNDAALTLQLNRLDGSTPVAAARQVMIMTSTTQYAPAGQPEASVTFGTATVGSIIASGQGWALVETSAAGAFACTATNTDNETIYFFTQTAARVSDPSKGCNVLVSNTDAAIWS